MSLDVRTLYCKIVNSRYDGKSHSFWPNDPRLNLGDYGRMDGMFFDRVGNIFDDQIVTQVDCPITPFELTTTDQIFTYGCQYGLEAGGVMGNTVTVNIEFASKESLLIYMHNLKTTSLNGLNNLQRVLNTRLQQGKWERQHSVVTELTTADNLRYYAYAGGKGTIALKANVSPDNFNIKQDFGQLEITANAGIKTELFHECTYADNKLFLYKARKLVKPILDLMGSPKLEVQAAANEFSNDASLSSTGHPEVLVLGEI